ncbi:YtxH domain-containing protein [Gracilibacillus oryzae]|uniref:YtxH domain-containing protein n=1 Tax=Gracilibacillus oryzae TaxID=1672701 RepID=A0A7C8GV75_9BACI|nr:YtxH domain-containing protein [Gracilibacillus oryzae]KAB8139026.1 YtxH domain-containing protein [Gracilibacillus oryzae]
MINAKSLFFGIIVGGAISATATLLSAPKSGKDLRYDVKHKGDEAIQAIKHLKEDGFDLKEQITQTSKEGAALIKDLSADVKQSIESWKQTVEPHQKNIQKYLNQIEKSLKELEEKTKKQTEEA